MAATNFTPISLYYSTTASAIPSAGNLIAGELALNTLDEKLYFKNSAGTVKLLASNATSAPVLSFQTSLSGLTPSTATTGVVTLAGTLGVASGGTGLTTLTAGSLPYGAGTSAFSALAIGTAGQILTSSGTAPQWTTLTSVSVTTFSAGTTGFTPSSATSGAVTLAGTLATTNGGTALTSFTSGGAVYATSTSVLTTGTLPVASGGTGVATITGIIKGSGTSAFSAATAGTDYVAPTVATTFTALQTFNGSSSVGALKTLNINEPATVSATAATGTINFDVTTQSVLYYTTSASANFTLNFRASSGTSLNTLMATGDSICVSFLCTNGATAYYNSLVQVDGSTVTPKYQGGTAWTSGNASSIDAYNFVIVKTGSAAFTILTSQTKFA